MKADLHMHSIYSDGLLSPDELARRAKEAGIALFSVTDHDNMGGDGEKFSAAEKYGLNYVRGWEISSYDGCKVHILGYACAVNDEYRRFLEERKRGALVRLGDMIQKANAYLHLSLTIEDAKAERMKQDAPLHTMHVVRAFARRLKKSAEEVYFLYFDYGKPAYSDLCRPTPEDAVDIIHRLGGIAVLAHPGRIALDFSAREQLTDRLVRRGLDGIECIYTTHTERETEYFMRYASMHGLLQTGGSDFHAEDGRHFIGKPNFEPDDKLLRALGL